MDAENKDRVIPEPPDPESTDDALVDSETGSFLDNEFEQSFIGRRLVEVDFDGVPECPIVTLFMENGQALRLVLKDRGSIFMGESAGKDATEGGATPQSAVRESHERG